MERGKRERRGLIKTDCERPAGQEPREPRRPGFMGQASITGWGRKKKEEKKNNPETDVCLESR